MNKIYRFNVHRYAPELNKCEILINNNWIEYPLPQSIVKHFNNDYKHNIKELRSYQKMIVAGKKVKIQFNHSYKPFNNNNNIRVGRIKNSRELLEFIRLYKSKNEGLNDIIIGFDNNDKPIYTTINNIINYKIEYIR